MRIRITQRFDAPADRVFDAWVNPDVARRWLFATAARPMTRVRIDARAGRSFFLEGDDGGKRVAWTGKYLEVIKPRRLIFAYSGNGRASKPGRIDVEIAPLDSGCELTLTHEAVPLELAAGIDGRWSGMLYGLAETLTDASRQTPAVSRSLTPLLPEARLGEQSNPEFPSSVKSEIPVRPKN